MTIPSGLAEEPIYLDYNATTPVDPAVVEATLPYLTGGFGNPSSDHTTTAPRPARHWSTPTTRPLVRYSSSVG